MHGCEEVRTSMVKCAQLRGSVHSCDEDNNKQKLNIAWNSLMLKDKKSYYSKQSDQVY